MENTPLLDSLLARLRAYCESERGLKTALCDYLQIRPHQLTAWLNGTRKPNGEYTLQIQQWLEEKSDF